MGLAMLPLYELPHWSKAEGGEARRGVARFVGLESIQLAHPPSPSTVGPLRQLRQLRQQVHEKRREAAAGTLFPPRT